MCQQRGITTAELKSLSWGGFIYSAGAFGPWRDLCAWASGKGFWDAGHGSCLLLGAAVLTFWGTFHCLVLSSNWTITTNLHTLFKSKALTIWILLLHMNLDGMCKCGGQRLTYGVFLNCSPLYLKRQSLLLSPAYLACPKDPHSCLQNTGVTGKYPHPLAFMWVLGIWNLVPQQAMSHLSSPNTLKFLTRHFPRWITILGNKPMQRDPWHVFVLFSAFEPPKWTL